MLLKVTLALAVGMLVLLMASRMFEAEDEARLMQRAESDLKALRNHLFGR